ncbi:SapC protein [Alteromonadaceae bacterium M269]|nr:SapC protein [Alteromonadaceae bacterium M269]
MNPSFVPLDKNKHKNLKVTLDMSFSSSKTAHLAAISLKEAPFAASAMPLIIIKTPQHGTYHLAGMMGVEPNTNLYHQDGKWQGHHVPWNVQRYPFDIRGDKEKVVIFFDENSDMVGDKEGEALFDGEGNATPYLERVRTLMSQIADSEVNSATFFKQIQEYDLLDPISVRVSFADGENKNLVGMYGISEQRLMALPDESIVALMRSGSLGMLYAMLTSVGQLNTLVRLSQTTAKPIANIQFGVDEGAEDAAQPEAKVDEAEAKPAAKAKKTTKKAAAKKAD